MNKQEMVDEVYKILQFKKERLANQIDSLQNDLKGETKSSMGDKYETSRAQLHLEIEKVQSQISVINSQLQQLNTIDFKQEFTSVKNGALVISENIQFLIGIGLGQISKKNNIYCISLESPIGKSLINIRIGDCFQVGNTNHIIQKIY